MRNPYYFGVFFELLGACFLYQARYALWFLFLVHMPLIVYRARLEEKVMLTQLSEYAAYRKRVGNLL
jgi:protein-S-isoprenylcysteine O-methyltransferase Ste14